MDAIPIEKLSDMVGSRYSLAVAAAKRARQLKEGAVPLVKCGSNHPLTIALHEIAAGKVVVKPLGEPGDDFLTDGRREETVQDTLADTDLFDGEFFGIDSDDEPDAEDVDLEDDDIPEDEEEVEDLLG